ncbi:alpha/beta fold hydrolase [Micromonospora okii]|uniref:alpha/beta fold hydrolase n=1 Tax=Micromonospora okii TaxID=1182970 RepID=UPI001E623E31|nr:alpha/beta hydrolase [Micromonospora okii]
MASIYRTSAGRDSIRQWCEQQLSAWPILHDRHVIRAQGEDTHVVVAGTGPVTVVFVAGDRFSAAAYLPLLTALAQRHRVVAADIPGQPGLSSGAAGAASGRLTWYGSWLGEVIEEATTGPVVVFGHSFGGAVALAADHSRIRGKVAVAPAGLCRLRVTPRVLLAFLSWLARPRAASSLRLLRILSAPGRAPRAELVEWMTLVARHARPVSSDDLVPAAARTMPTLIASGDQDVFLPPARLRSAAQQRCHVDADIIPAAGHLVTDEHPDQLAALVARLVN